MPILLLAGCSKDEEKQAAAPVTDWDRLLNEWKLGSRTYNGITDPIILLEWLTFSEDDQPNDLKGVLEWTDGGLTNIRDFNLVPQDHLLISEGDTFIYSLDSNILYLEHREGMSLLEETWLRVE